MSLSFTPGRPAILCCRVSRFKWERRVEVELPAGIKAGIVRFAPRIAVIVGVVALVASGCARGPAPSAVQGGAEPAPRQTKILRIGTTREPTTGLIAFATGSGALDPALTFHSSLTVYDAEGRLVPRLAESVPTIDSGDWVVDPDGGMRLTWRLRANARWQDGTPLSVEDFILGLHFSTDNEIPVPKTPWAAAVDSIQAVDGRTMTVSW
jgi:peptide/nickel transport system substrate-binding protein